MLTLLELKKNIVELKVVNEVVSEGVHCVLVPVVLGPLFSCWHSKTWLPYQHYIVCTDVDGTCWLVDCVSESTSSPEPGLDGYAGSQGESSGSQESLSAVNVDELIQVLK